MISLRCSDELAERLTEKATADGVSRNDLIVRLIESGLQAEGLDALMLSVSQITCLDQLAERRGVSRIELMRRWLSERLRREFVDDRNSKLQDLKPSRA